MRVALLLGSLALLTTTSACSSSEPVTQRLPSSVTTSAPAAAPTPDEAPVRTEPVTPPVTPPPTPVVAAGDGEPRAVPPGATAASGSGTPTPYVVEVEGGLGVDAAAFAAEVERILGDPRSWGAGGRRAMRRVGAGEPAVLHVVLASPGLTDRMCAPLRTNGRYSCGNGERAVLNSARWLTGADSYAGLLPRYREYLVNHEVGHVLGHGHADCPGPGETAPVMLQQTKGLYGCERNPWPYP